MPIRGLFSLGAVCLLLPTLTLAQARQPFSAQASALYTVQELGTAGSVGGVGIEVQVRYNPSRYSFGLGGQFSHHSSDDQQLDLSGIFFEPRVAIGIGRDNITPYLAGRVVFLRQTSDFPGVPKFSTNGTAFGAGGGVLIHLTPRMNFDAGAAYLRQSFADKSFDSGGSVDFEPFNGYVVKAGLTLGLGSR